MGRQGLLNYCEVAELLAVSTKTVQRLVARAELPVVRVAGAARFDSPLSGE